MRSEKYKFTSRRFIRKILFFVLAMALITVGLLITNEKSLHDTITDIIILFVGVIALMMAVMTESEIERQEIRMNKIHKEINVALEEIKEVNKNSEYIKGKLREEEKIDLSISDKIDKISVSGLKK